MKKLFLFFLLSSQSILFSQTVLNSFPLNLNLSEAQLLNIEDVKTHDVYVFASDNKNINILKYNQSLFLTSQFTDSIRYAADRVLLGYSIGADKAPLLYWSSSNLRNIRIIKYFTETKTTRSLNFDFPEAHDYILASFQKNNIFYILAKEKAQQHLLLYKFENGNCEIKMFDFSPFTFQNGRGQSFSFTTLIRYYPIQMMESDDFNSIDKTSNINKLYVLDDRLILTLDYNSKKTQVFDLNMETAEITEKTFDLPVSVKPSRTANSFYSDKKLFQMTANKDQFLFTIKDYDTGKTIKSSSISKNDTIQFKNSPFFIQNNNNRPQELKTTAKFLRNLADLSAGISVIKNNKNNFITFGGFVEYVDSDYMYNTDEIFNFSGMRSLSRMVYFDAMLNENYDFVKDVKSEPLAVDNLFYYLNVNKGMMLQNSLKLKDYYILSYYDIASKQFIMRKFTNGFVNEDNGNPIMNKSIFSRPASFEDIKQP
ncbi:hypothetical protein [Flavobacterium gelatinilyticum]|uniref:hypothetical protein n=1 Tax=Flavobacterium gelatinilyticum TaxID=3003260 RepID=UPI0024805597|nr:hypothetical protein [Flavobacterium gelatinilyticum]